MPPTFDPDTFMQQTVDQPLDTEYFKCPEGEYPAMIGEITSQNFETFDFTYRNGPQAGQPGSMTKLNIPFVINDDKLKAATGRDQIIVNKQIILDLKDGALDFGKNRNVELGRVRQAVGQNNPGPWTFANLSGAGPVMVRVEHRTFKRKDGTQGENAEVTGVVALR